MSPTTPGINDYHVGWISAVGVEFVIACELLDEEYPDPPHVPTDDENSYCFGRIGGHRVVIVCLPKGRYGLTSSASAAAHMRRSFPAIQFWLMVGIGGGAPSERHDIRLGDVVVSTPGPRHGGVIQYDHGKTIQDRVFERTSSLNAPPMVLLSAIQKLEQRHRRRGHDIDETIQAMLESNKRLRREYRKPAPATDILYAPSFVHSDDSRTCAQLCAPQTDHIVSRPERDEDTDQLQVHYGLIASANQVLKDALVRDYLAAAEGVLCFEMEAAGLMDRFSCIVIRGVCDYCDTHKNDIWQGYAAATAAVYAKQLLSIVATRPQHEQERGRRVDDTRDLVVHEDLGVSSVMNDAQIRLSDDELACLRSLWFSDMDDRRSNISRATEGTCLWLIDHPHYRQWRSRGHGLLWVKGKPGAGKSVLLDTMLRTVEEQQAKDRIIVASFFAHGRGSPMQKSAVGLYRSLLHQLVGQIRPLLNDFRKMYQKNIMSKGQPGASWDWHEKSLFEFFNTSVKEYARTSRVMIFVDALDEFGEAVAGKVADELRSLTSGTKESDLGLSVCFACRHFPNIDVHDGLEIIVEDENTDDISRYISTALSPAFPLSPQRTMLEGQIKARASGLFLWVVLIIPEIIQLGRDGYNVTTASLLVKNTPKDLELLFEGLLSRIRPFDRLRSLRLIQWVCFAQWPLSIPELQYAMSFDEQSPPKSLATWVGSEHFISTAEQMEKQLRALSGGLLELQGSSRRVVQFIHQSVKDYFMEHGMIKLEQSLQIDSNETHSGNILGRAHDVICKCCLHYLFAEDVCNAHDDVFEEFENSSEDGFFAGRKRDAALKRLRDQYVLLEYAALFWHVHSKQAETLGVSQASRLQDFGWPSLLLLRHWMRLVSSPLGASSTMLHVAAVLGLTTMLTSLLSTGDKLQMNAKGKYGRTPFLQAVDRGHFEAAKLLLESGADINLPDQDEAIPLHFAASNGNVKLAELVLDHGSAINHQDSFGRTALSKAVRAGQEQTTALLLRRGALPTTGGKNSVVPLYWAAMRCSWKMLDMLVQLGADTNIHVQGIPFSEYMVSPKHWKENENDFLLAMQARPPEPQLRKKILFEATGEGQLIIVRGMLKTDEDIDLVSGAGRTLMQVAVNRSQLHVAQFLLQKGAKPVALHHELIDEAVRRGLVPLTTFLLNTFSEVILSRSGFTPIFAAINAENESIVELLVSKGIDLEQRNESGSLPLCIAAYRGHKRIVELLLQEGANVMAKDSLSRTPLLYATANQDIEMATRLLSAGADPNMADKNGLTPLLNAIFRKDINIVRLLLTNTPPAEHGATDFDGRTPLSWAAEIGYRPMVELLLEYSALPETRDSNGATPLHWAIKPGHVQIVGLLLDQGAGLDTLDREGNSPLWYAILNRRLPLAEVLIKRGADVHSKNTAGQTLVEYAMSAGFPGIVEVLITSGKLQSNSITQMGALLVWAAGTGQKNLARMLLQTDGNAGFDNIHGTTALFEAIDRGQADMVDLLIQAKVVAVDCQDRGDRTVLWRAITKGDMGVVRVLIRRGANLKHLDSLCRTPLLYACQFGNNAIVKALLQACRETCNQCDAAGRSPLWWATDSNHTKVMGTLLQMGEADLNITSSSGDSALSRAIKKSHLSATELLLDYGAACNFGLDIESAPLTLAVENNSEDIVLLLIERGARFDYLLPSGQTLLCWAAKQGHVKVVRVLLEKGVDPEAKGPYDRSALHWASEMGHSAVLRLLIEHAMK